MPFLSIIIPIFNGAEKIGATINQLLQQSYCDFELILVNDGSNDDTQSVIERYSLVDNRIAVINQDNKGAARARNAGYMSAQGKYLMFLDADDSYSHDYLSEMVKSAKQSNADLVVCEANAFDVRTGELYPLIRFPNGISGCLERNRIGPNLFSICYTAPWNKMYKKSLIDSHHLSFQDIPSHNDIYFVCSALAYSETISFVNKDLVAYSIGSGNSIQDKRVLHPYCEFDALDKLCEEFVIASNDTGDDEIREAIAALVVNGFYNSAPAVLKKENDLGRLLKRYRTLMDGFDSHQKLPLKIKMKKMILEHSSITCLDKSFSSFSDQRRHSRVNKIHFILSIICTGLKDFFTSPDYSL